MASPHVVGNHWYLSMHGNIILYVQAGVIAKYLTDPMCSEGIDIDESPEAMLDYIQNVWVIILHIEGLL